MSATLGTLLKELAPEWEIKVFEKLATRERKAPTNGIMPEPDMLHCVNLTIHSERPDGTVDISKAIKVNEQFQISKQFWSYLVDNKLIQ